jgi:hypothetical protein
MVKPLRLFKCDHAGKFVFGMSVVVAPTKNAAIKLLKAALSEAHISTDEEINCQEIDLTQPGVHMMFDGLW